MMTAEETPRSPGVVRTPRPWSVALVTDGVTYRLDVLRTLSRAVARAEHWAGQAPMTRQSHRIPFVPGTVRIDWEAQCVTVEVRR